MKIRKQIYLGYDAQGRQIRKWISADSKTELKKKIEQYKEDIRKVSNPSDVTFQDYAKQWLRVYKSNRAKQTVDMYDNALKKCGDIDPVPIKKVTKSMCQGLVNDHWIHPSAAEDLASTLRQVFKSAMADGIIATNPAGALTLPKKPQSKFYLLTKEDLKKIKNAQLNDADRLLVTILQVFGLRPAEALALNPADFDWKEGVLHITKAVELTNDNKSRIKATKTEVSRDIPIPEELIPLLREQIRGKRTLLLFPKADGLLYTKSAYRRLSERIHKAINNVVINEKLKKLKKEDKTKEAKIRSTDFFPDFTLYCFRHRRATDLYYLTQTGQISTMYAASTLGHSVQVFLSTYSHIDQSKESKNIYSNVDLKLVRNW